MATRRRYTRAQKVEAIGIAIVEGQTVAAEKTGTPLTTINAWWHSAEFVELRTKSNQEVAGDMWAVVQTGLRRIAELIPLTDDIAKVAVATGTVYDKRALLTGEATSRSEHRDISDPDDAAVDAFEGRIAWAPTKVGPGVVAGSNGANTNGKH